MIFRIISPIELDDSQRVQTGPFIKNGLTAEEVPETYQALPADAQSFYTLTGSAAPHSLRQQQTGSSDGTVV